MSCSFTAIQVDVNYRQHLQDILLILKNELSFTDRCVYDYVKMSFMQINVHV